jgi:hypothetical protein
MNMDFETFSFRHAEEILNAHLAIKREISETLSQVPEGAVASGPEGLTARIVTSFLSRKWEKEVLVMENQPHEQRFDLFKDRVAVEIEFSRYEFLSRDYLRFLSAYNADKIDVGAL